MGKVIDTKLVSIFKGVAGLDASGNLEFSMPNNWVIASFNHLVEDCK